MTNKSRAIQRLAMGSFGVIKFTIKEIANTSSESNVPNRRTAGNISSLDLFCCSVANRSHSINLSLLTKFVTSSINCNCSNFKMIIRLRSFFYRYASPAQWKLQIVEFQQRA